MRQNDRAWEKLFLRYRIPEQVRTLGRCLISAGQIREYREPRLMTKFDHQVNLPDIFRENGFSILPVSRGDYTISTYQAYHSFEPPGGGIERIAIPLQFQSLLPQFLVSEAIALNCAAASGILADFLGEADLVPTVSGRMGSGCFSFGIRTTYEHAQVEVNNAQIEIDAAYEGAESLALFEAKRDLAEDFLVRQLYYPYRVWQGRLAKRVRPVFLIYSGGTFYLYEYAFEIPGEYNSIRLVRQKNYVIRTDITRRDLWELVQTVRHAEEPGIPFPQANHFPRLLNLMELLSQGDLTQDEITEEYAFDVRQTNYYTAAGRYLGFIDRHPVKDGSALYCLTPWGRAVMEMGYRERMLAIGGAILMHRPFRKVFRFWLRHGVPPSPQEVLEIMRSSKLYHVTSESTLKRRASTVVRWCSWLMSLTDESSAGYLQYTLFDSDL